MARGDIVKVDLPPPAGQTHEQAGQRPALIVHNDSTFGKSSVVIIVPFTSTVSAVRFPHTIQVPPTPANGLTSVSVALVGQLRAIDRRRLGQKVGTLEPATLTRIDDEIRSLLSVQK